MPTNEIHVLRDAEIWIDDQRISTFLASVEMQLSSNLQEAPVFHDTAIRRVAGLMDADLQANGYYDAGKVSALFSTMGITNVPISVAPESAEGTPVFFMRAMQGQLSMFGEVGTANPFSLAANSSDGSGVIAGNILHNATKTATGAATGQQLGAVAAGEKIYAALHVIGASVADTLDVIVESDDNSGFTTPTTRITFGQKTAIASEWASPVVGPITDDWWRVSYTIGGTTPSFDFVVAFGIQ